MTSGALFGAPSAANIHSGLGVVIMYFPYFVSASKFSPFSFVPAGWRTGAPDHRGPAESKSRNRHPPSTESAGPVINAASSEQSQIAARATSSGSPARPRGTFFDQILLALGVGFGEVFH